MVPKIRRKGYVQEAIKKAGHELFKQATNEYAPFLCDQVMAMAPFGNVYSFALHADTCTLFLVYSFLSFILCFTVTLSCLEYCLMLPTPVVLVYPGHRSTFVFASLLLIAWNTFVGYGRDASLSVLTFAVS